MQSITDQEIKFFINGEEHKVPGNLPSTTSLNDYIRDVSGLKGTKIMCREAGCGCCAVTVTHTSPDTDKLETYSIQSCITPLYAVDGWQITTVEGLGSQRKGFHSIQKRIAEFNGSQCGYCTPGMVMNMYGLLHQNPDITPGEIENSFDSNFCRCTGYRPILDAMKSFSNDGNVTEAKSVDIEDLNKHLCPRTGESCTGDKGGSRCLDLNLPDGKWFRPTSLDGLCSIFKSQSEKKIRLFFGNTESGIYKNEGPFDVYIDLHRVKEIHCFEVKSDRVKFGAGTTLTDFIFKLKANQDKPGYKYFNKIVHHMKSVASVMVRNVGSIAGNLMIKHNHQDFPSDIFTIFEAAGALVEIYDSGDAKSTLKTTLEFLKVDMTGKVITAVELPKLDDPVVFRTFKISPRWQNAHAYVNAAFKIPCSGRLISGKPSIVFGGIGNGMIHAVKTEDFLLDKTLSESIVNEALLTLKEEVNPAIEPTSPSPKYRQDLTVSLLYKVLLGIYKPEKSTLQSGSDILQRPISTGLQTYQELKKEAPLKQGMPKITSPLQASGEAQYVDDIPKFQHEVFGAFVIGDQGSAVIQSVDPSEALKMPGVLRFITAEDIPEGGENNYMPPGYVVFSEPQKVFSSREVKYSGQAVGLIVAESRAQAFAAAKKVNINYSEVHKPILTIEESIEAGKEYSSSFSENIIGNPDDAWNTVDKIVSGEIKIGSQTHFVVENHVSLAVPSEDGIDLYTSSQWSDMSQHAAALIIGEPINYINCVVPRIGGGFGGKTWDGCSTAAAATLTSYVTGRPARVVMDLSNVMTMCGKRPTILSKYKVGFNKNGDVQVIEIDHYVDCGHTTTGLTELDSHRTFMDLGYHIPNWKYRPHPMMTNKQTISPMRAPAAVPSGMVIETIMEHVAYELNKHPIIVKEINLYENGQTTLSGRVLSNCSLKELWRRLKDTAEVEGRMRHVEEFNKQNLLKKRGITMTSCKYGMVYHGPGYAANVSIFSRDGTVVVSQGGVEMGQGLYTKVAQGVAHTLGIPLDSIKIRPNQSIIAPNASLSGGSITSESSMMSAIGACNILRERMQPMREKFPDADWKELCQKCVDNKIDLSAKHTFVPPSENSDLTSYYSSFVAVVETEVDILTGESQIRRVDIMADLGESLNPTIDIGQIEGAFVMGLGAYLTEDIIFDETSGRILSDGTWTYKPPMSKDIPVDFRVHLLPDSPNPTGVRNSRAVGEPPIILSVGALLANKLAVHSARKDFSNSKDFMITVAPYTVEKVHQSIGLEVGNLTVN